MVEEDELMEIFTLPTMSHDAQRLVELHARWIELRQERGRTMPEGAFVEAVRDVAARVVEHRGRLFEVIADLNVAGDAGPAADGAYEANRDAVKFCTVLLGEMNAALGLTSLPAPSAA